MSCRVMLRGFFRVMLGLHMMAVRQMGVMSGAFVFARFMMVGGSGVVVGSLLMVMRGLAVMIGSFFRHGVLSFVEIQGIT